jgi:hypothetical protein
MHLLQASSAFDCQGRPGQVTIFATTLAVLGQTLVWSNGHQDPTAMRWLTGALLLLVVGITLPRAPRFTRFEEPIALGILGCALAWQFAMAVHNAPGIYLRQLTGWEQLFYRLGISSAAVLAGLGFAKSQPLGRWRLPLLFLCFLLLGVWMIQASPNPIIDVDVVQRESATALLRGQNPFAITFKNIYGHTAFSGKNSTNEVLNAGFPYPPWSLLLIVPAQALFSDYRYAHMLAILGSAILMAASGRNRISEAIATTFLFTPKVFFVIEQGWTDPLLLLAFSSVCFLANRRPHLVPYALGLAFGLKQYAVLSALFSWLLPKPLTWRIVGTSAAKALLVFALAIVPFLAWNSHALIFSAILNHLGFAPRPDALSFTVWLGLHFDDRFSWLNLATLAAAIALAAWRTPRNAAGFAAALALLFFVFFSFGGHAFCNHYYFVTGLTALAAAYASAPTSALTTASPPQPPPPA